MEPAGSAEEPGAVKYTVQKTLQANKDHQYALKVYTERLEAELRTIDKLLHTADIGDEDEEPELDAGGLVSVPNSERVTFPISASEFLSMDSPFREDAEKRNRYINYTATHPMKAKELEVLAEAVRTENHRKRALEAQTGGLPTFARRDDKDFFEWNTDGIEWSRVAEKVSTAANFPRTAQDCAIRWLGDRHPQFVHTAWTASEIEKLQTLVENAPERPLDWVEIANKLGTNRTPLACMRHGLQRQLHVWRPESDAALLTAINIYGVDNWLLVASHVSEDATPQQCRSRFERTLDPNIQRGFWTTEEDDRLRLAVRAYGATSWAEVAEVIQGRTNDQCRDRWQDNLNPTLAKGKWTAEEDQLLWDAVASLGVSNWKLVSEQMANGRTDNNCRTRHDKLVKQRKSKTSAHRGAVSMSVNAQACAVTEETTGDGDGNTPDPGPSAPSDSRRARARKTPTAELEQDEGAPPIERPRPRPNPRPRKKLDKAVVPEVAGEPAATPTAPVGEKGKGKEKPAPPTRKRKRSKESEGTTPAKKKPSRKAAAKDSEIEAADGKSDDLDFEETAPTPKKRGRPPRKPTTQVPPVNETEDQSQAMYQDQGMGQIGGFATSQAVGPTRRQPSRAASKNKMLIC